MGVNRTLVQPDALQSGVVDKVVAIGAIHMSSSRFYNYFLLVPGEPSLCCSTYRKNGPLGQCGVLAWHLLTVSRGIACIGRLV